MKRIVEVIWSDCRFVHGWADEIEGLVEVRSYGVLVFENPEYLAVAPCVADTTSPYGQVITIPRSAIHKVTELRQVPKKRRT